MKKSITIHLSTILVIILAIMCAKYFSKINSLEDKITNLNSKLYDMQEQIDDIEDEKTISSGVIEYDSYSTEPSPCPFCGSEVCVMKRDNLYFVSCLECGAQSAMSSDVDYIIGVWNERDENAKK